MANELAKYEDLIKETISKFGFNLPLSSYGVAFHRVYVDGSGNVSDYELAEVNDKFIELTGLNISQINDVKYSVLFPENKETKFDWVALLGQAGMSDGRTRFQCFSELLQKWFLFFAFGPQKGYAFLIFEDITKEKIAEIQRMNIRRANAPVSEDTD
jgi:hypothetical protein